MQLLVLFHWHVCMQEREGYRIPGVRTRHLLYKGGKIGYTFDMADMALLLTWRF